MKFSTSTPQLPGKAGNDFLAIFLPTGVKE